VKGENGEKSEVLSLFGVGTKRFWKEINNEIIEYYKGI